MSAVCHKEDPISITVKCVDRSNPNCPVGHLPRRYELVTRVLFYPIFIILSIQILTTNIKIIFAMYFLPIMTIITKIFPQIPKIKDTNIITAPVYIAPCDGPIALDWFKVTFV